MRIKGDRTGTQQDRPYSTRPYQGILSGLEYIPDPEVATFPALRFIPQGLIIHCSGETDKRQRIKRVSYHIEWDSERNVFVQCVPVNVRATHLRLNQGNTWLGICFPGPVHREYDEHIYQEWVRVINVLDSVFYLKYWCRHSDLESTCRDPGMGFNERFIQVLIDKGIRHGFPLSSLGGPRWISRFEKHNYLKIPQGE
jgi:hypothetical protein